MDEREVSKAVPQGRRRSRQRRWALGERPLSKAEVHSIIGGMFHRALTDDEVARYTSANLGYLRSLWKPYRPNAKALLEAGEVPTFRQVREDHARAARALVESIAESVGMTGDELMSEVLRCIEYVWQTSGQGPEWAEVADAVGITKQQLYPVLQYMRHNERTVFFTPEHRSLRLRDAEGEPVPPLESAKPSTE